MAKTYGRYCDIVGITTYALNIAPKILDAIVEMKVAYIVRTCGVADFNLATFSSRRSYAVEGIIDVSPTLEEIKNSQGYAGDEQRAEDNRGSWEVPTMKMFDRVVGTQTGHL